MDKPAIRVIVFAFALVLSGSSISCANPDGEEVIEERDFDGVAQPSPSADTQEERDFDQVPEPSPSVGTQAKESHQDEVPEIKIFYNNPLSFDRPSENCISSVCKGLLELINSADKTIDIAVYGMRNQSILLEALERARRRGVLIRGIVDVDNDGEYYYISTPEWSSILGPFKTDTTVNECDIPNHWNEIMHNKFMIVDGSAVWTGSTNISDTGTGGYNANIAAIFKSESVASTYSQEFEQMWSGQFACNKQRHFAEVIKFPDAEVSIWFSPQDRPLVDQVIPLIENAQDQIDIAVFYLTSEEVTNAIIEANARKVDVRVIVGATSAENASSKHDVLRSAGVPLKIESWGGKMHMKAASIDGRYLILGSMNWTNAGNGTNDENTVIIDSSNLSIEFSSFFNELWESIPSRWGLEGERPLPESLDSGTSCYDGIDNDFDPYIDEDDWDCD